MINPFSVLPDKLLEEYSKKITIIDRNYLKNIIKNWKIKGLEQDENGDVQNKYAVAELDRIAQKIIGILPQNINYTILCKNNYEIKSAIDNYILQGTMSLYLICLHLFHYYVLKEKTQTNEQIVFSNLTKSIIDNYQGLLFSYLSGDYLTVIQKTRIVYECYVIFVFINKHHGNNGEELATAFLDHLNIIQNRIIKNTTRENEINKEDIDALKNKYGNDFNDNYGWTKSVISEKGNRTLGFMAGEVGMDNGMSFIYKWTSNFIHTNAFSINAKKLIDPKVIDTYLPFTVDMLIRQVATYIEKVSNKKEETNFISVLLNGLEKAIFPEDMFSEKQGL